MSWRMQLLFCFPFPKFPAQPGRVAAAVLIQYEPIACSNLQFCSSYWVKALCCYMAQKERMSTVTKWGRDREYLVCLKCVVGIKYFSLCPPFSLFTYLHSMTPIFPSLFPPLCSLPVFHTLCAHLHPRGMSETLHPFSTSLTITICRKL